MIIVACLDDNILKEIKDCSTAFDMWQALDEKYQKKNVTIEKKIL